MQNTRPAWITGWRTDLRSVWITNRAKLVQYGEAHEYRIFLASVFLQLLNFGYEYFLLYRCILTRGTFSRTTAGSPRNALYKVRFEIFTAVRLKIKSSRVLRCVDCKYLSTFRRTATDSTQCELFVSLRCVTSWKTWLFEKDTINNTDHINANEMQFFYILYLVLKALHVSDALYVHHQEHYKM